MARLFSLSNPAPSKVSFGTTGNRDLLPLQPPHTRAGNELGLRGQVNIAPGAYDNHEVSSFVYEMDKRPVCKRGYSLGSRTASRFAKEANTSFPGPPAHQPIISKKREFIPAYKPFQCGATRLPSLRQDATPGAGAYEHGVGTDRKVQFHGTFGGPQTLRSSIVMICHNGEPDVCALCNEMPNGDYYRNKTTAMCRECYDQHSKAPSANAAARRKSGKFTKVRDCRNVHGHEGTNAKLRLMTDKDLKKLRTREAYMSLYYS